MRKFTASMISKGNHLFQASITILDNGVKLRIPNFWRDQETFFSFNDISGVELTTPSWYTVLTYSTINFNLRGTWVDAHGFAKSDAITIKRMIEGGRQSGGNSSINEFGEDTNKFSGYKQQQWINYQHDREVKKDREERISRKNEQNKELIPKLQKLIVDTIISKRTSIDYIYVDKMLEKIGQYEINLSEILFDIYGDDYWIERDFIKKEITESVNKYFQKQNISTNSIEDDDQGDYEDEVSSKFSMDMEDDIDEKVPQGEAKIRLKIRVKITKKIIKLYDDLDLELLENEDEVIKNKKIIGCFTRRLYNKHSRKNLKKIFEEFKNEQEDNEYLIELEKLFIIIKRIFRSGILGEVNPDGSQKFPFGLEKESVQLFIKNIENPLRNRLSKIIDCTDNLIDRIEKDRGL